MWENQGHSGAGGWKTGQKGHLASSSDTRDPSLDFQHIKSFTHVPTVPHYWTVQPTGH